MKLLAIALALTGLTLLQRRWAMDPAQRQLRPQMLTDVGFVALNQLLVKPAAAAVTLAAAVLTALALGLTPGPALADGRGAIAAQPRWLQGVEVLMLADLLGYWIHRGFHSARLWRFHAVHHSSEHLDCRALRRRPGARRAHGAAGVALPSLRGRRGVRCRW
jgi:sterol desaturase/sphingolipid hydroxylase (fatty acid hydroxylase superfamily)